MRHGPRSVRRIALTFDDGPGPLTELVLDALGERGARATFNVLAERVAGHPELIARTLAEGHELGNHSFAHDRLARHPLRAYRELARANAAIGAAAGVTPRVFRPPYGAWSRGLVAAARGAGLLTVNWDVSPRDWENPGVEAIRERVVSRARPGSIVVLHDERRATEQTPLSVRAILRDLEDYEFVTVSELLGLAA